MSKFLETIAASWIALLNYFANRKCVFVLMYHRVNDNLPPNDLIMPVRLFREQMVYLQKYCHVLGVEELGDVISGRYLGRQRRPQVLITIDDGYRDTFLNAYPVLRELNLPAAVFLSTGFIGTDKAMGRYEHMPVPDMLNWEEVDIMRKGNIVFAGHTVSHPHLTALTYEQQKAEIEGSIKAVFERTGAQASRTVFCYTYGEYNDDTLRILRELGVKTAFTVCPGVNTVREKPLELNRIAADGRHGMFHFIMTFAPPIIAGLKWRLQMKRKKEYYD